MLVVAQEGVQFPALVNFVMNPLRASKLCRFEMSRKEDQSKLRVQRNYKLCKILGFHGGDYEECRLLECGSRAATCSSWFLARGFSTLKMEAIRSSEMSVYRRSTWRHIQKTAFIRLQAD
jgi:hypothetical protein